MASVYRTPADPAGSVALVRVWSTNGPVFEPIEPCGDRWILGRDTIDPASGDSRMSRRHCEVLFAGGTWEIRDLGSANGTSLDAEPLKRSVVRDEWTVLQIGRSLFVPLSLMPGVPLQMTRNHDTIVGPGLYLTCAAIRVIAAQRSGLVLAGPAGCGFEELARHYLHALGTGGALRVESIQRLPLDVAASPPGVLLVTGPAPMHRYAEHQSLARAYARSDLRVCLAIECDPGDPLPVLPQEIAASFTIVRVPGLEARPEEVPWWVARAAAAIAPALVVDVTYVEECLLRTWAGGLVNLRGETRNAAEAAHLREQPLKARHLCDSAGAALDVCIPFAGQSRPQRRREPPGELHDRERFAELLREASGDLVLLARRLGVTVESIEQWVRRHRLDETP